MRRYNFCYYLLLVTRGLVGGQVAKNSAPFMGPESMEEVLIAVIRQCEAQFEFAAVLKRVT